MAQSTLPLWSTRGFLNGGNLGAGVLVTTYKFVEPDLAS